MNLLKAASTVSLLTLASRITGLVRELLVAATFGANATTDAFNVALRIPNLLRRLFAEGAFSTTFQVSNIAAGTGAPNVVPVELKVRFNLRFSAEQTVETLQRTVTGILDRHRVDYTLEWFVSGLPFLAKPGHLTATVARAVQDVTGRVPAFSTTGGTSDGRFIAPTGAQVVELGDINATIHKVNECVRVEDVDVLSRLYERVMERLLAVVRSDSVTVGQ